MISARDALLAAGAIWIGCASVSDGQAFVPTAGGGRTNTTASWMVEAGPAVAPFGHLVFCRRHPGECRAEPARVRRAPVLTRSRRMELDTVNRRVNQRIHAANDGAVDTWSLAARYGDCEDFAIAKRHELIERGWPAGALLLATARIPGGVNHAVLVVHTSDGDYVLDNLRTGVTAWSALPYRWLKRQSRTNPKRWVSLRPGRTDTATAGLSRRSRFSDQLKGPVLPRPRPILDAADRQAHGARQTEVIADRSGIASGAEAADRI